MLVDAIAGGRLNRYHLDHSLFLFVDARILALSTSGASAHAGKERHNGEKSEKIQIAPRMQRRRSGKQKGCARDDDVATTEWLLDGKVVGVERRVTNLRRRH